MSGNWIRLSVMGVLFVTRLALGAEFYVAPDGSDAGPGTKSKPFATVERGRDAARELIKQGLKEDVTVYLRGGTYYIMDPVVFDSRDTGSENCSVTYAAFPGEQPLISGGRVIKTRWEKVDDSIWKTHLPDVKAGAWWFRSLYIEGKRLTYRNHHKIEAKTWVYSVLQPDTTADPKLVRSVYDWAMDRESGTLYYNAGKEDPNGKEFIAPKATELLIIQGLQEKPIKNLIFEDILFSHTYWPLPEKGLRDAWAGAILFRSGWKFGKDDIGKPIEMSAAIEVEFAHNCVFKNCRISQVEGHGIGLGRGTRECRVAGCELSDIGCCGIVDGWWGNMPYQPKGRIWLPRKKRIPFSSRKETAIHYWGEEAFQPVRNMITDNWVHHCGVYYKSGMGIKSIGVHNPWIEHNLVHDIGYSGIGVSDWTLNPRPGVDVPGKSMIAANNIYRCLTSSLNDGGTIYISNWFSSEMAINDRNYGITVIGNYLHDSNGLGSGGIYLDEIAFNLLALENVIPKTFIHANRQATVGLPPAKTGNIKPDYKGEIDTHLFSRNRNAKHVDLAAVKSVTGPREPHRTKLGLLNTLGKAQAIENHATATQSAR